LFLPKAAITLNCRIKIMPATDIDKLKDIMDELREKCPWDKKQTIESLRHLTIEETYELAGAITDKNWQHIREELGDILLHIVFYSKIAEEISAFKLQDVIDGVCEKLISRHPHIYGDVKVNNEHDVKLNWEKLKLKEGKKGVLSGVPQALPALVKSLRIQEKAKSVGFEWENKEQVWKKVEEEQAELQQAEKLNDTEAIEDEFGDLLFSLINYARFLKVDPEAALERTNRKFISRFNKMEQEAIEDNRQLTDMTLDEMDAIWNRVKKQ